MPGSGPGWLAAQGLGARTLESSLSLLSHPLRGKLEELRKGRQNRHESGGGGRDKEVMGYRRWGHLVRLKEEREPSPRGERPGGCGWEGSGP